MWSTCLFCHSSLGANEVIEHFPVGRRLAFDAAKGRLWVVCRQCERWNLTPLEERWEAVEECERLFRETRLRVSTENIGLARVREGLELVRIGAPQRPEMAAWRYGDQFGRRRRRHFMLSGAGIALVGGFLVAGPATGLIAGGGWGVFNIGAQLYNVWDQNRIRARVRRDEDDVPLAVRKADLARTSIAMEDESTGWTLHVPHITRVPLRKLRHYLYPELWGVQRYKPPQEIARFTGDEALRIAGQLLPHINSAGARQRDVQDAVRLIEAAADPAALFTRQAQSRTPTARFFPVEKKGITGRPLRDLPTPVRLALEMAAHEDSERRALEGELALLERAWQDAEEIAAIADKLALPGGVDVKLENLKR